MRGAYRRRRRRHDARCSRPARSARTSARSRATRDINFRLEAGARHALIGPNGAGKTTFINLLTGVLPPTRGRGAAQGPATSRRSRRPSASSSASPAPSRSTGCSAASRCWRTSTSRSPSASAPRPTCSRPAGSRRDVIEEAMQLLETLKLADDRAQDASPNCPTAASGWSSSRSRSGLKPEVLLLDEPAAGVPSAESHIILDAIDALPKHIGVLIIDHDMDLVFRFAKRITVLVSGAVFAEGTPKEIGANPRRARGLSRAGRAMASALELQGRVGRLRRDRRARGHQPRARAGREHQRDRPQRRRQDHAAGDHHGPHHAAQGRGAARRARASTACRSIARALAGLGFVPQEREIFPSLSGAREPRRRRAAGPLDAGAGVRAVPEPARSGSPTWATSSPAASSRCCRSRARC